jgi:hypothetical protein
MTLGRAPSFARRWIAISAAAFCSLTIACTITQRVMPVPPDLQDEVCIIENPAVRPGFVAEYQSALGARGYRHRMLPEDARSSDCLITSTYIGRWSWDMALYMSYAEIKVYNDGRLVGEALYDSTHGGGRIFEKFIDAEPKIQELVAELFPAR